MNNKKILMIAVILTCIALVWIAYQNLVAIPQNKLNYEKERDLEAQERETLKKARYSICVINAEKDYNENWQLNCKDRGLKDNCNLPAYLADQLGDDLNEARTKTCPIVAENNY